MGTVPFHLATPPWLEHAPRLPIDGDFQPLLHPTGPIISFVMTSTAMNIATVKIFRCFSIINITSAMMSELKRDVTPMFSSRFGGAPRRKIGPVEALQGRNALQQLVKSLLSSCLRS